MEKNNRADDMISVLQLNNAINDIYEILYKLEIEGKKDSEEYESYVEMIRFSSSKCDDYLTRYPLSDDYIEKFLQMLIDNNGYDMYEIYDYTKKVDNIKHRRLINHLFELALYHHDTETKNVGKAKMYISGQEYDFDDGLSMLEEMGYSQIADQFMDYEKLLLQDEFDYSLDDYYYAKMQLEAHVFMLYLLEAINEEKDTRIRNGLIKIKYQVIGTVRGLEKSFLFDQNMNFDLDYYKEELDALFANDGKLYLDYISYQEEIIRHEQDKLLDRNKEEYQNIDDQVQDIILSLMIKTRLSCIPNSDLKEALIEDLEAADELSKSKIDKKILKRAIKINKNYEYTQKYN